MEFLDWAALILGAILIFDGIRTVKNREAHVPERYAGDSAVHVGWLWIILGVLFVSAVAFDIAPLKSLFRLFPEAPN